MSSTRDSLLETFERKGQASEQRYVADRDSEFVLEARRDRHVVHWAARLLGLPAEAEHGYFSELVGADLQRLGVDDLVAKLMADFRALGVEVTEAQVRARALLQSWPGEGGMA